MTTFQIFSGCESSIIKVLCESDLFYKFEYIEWCNKTYIHIKGRMSVDTLKELSAYTY